MSRIRSLSDHGQSIWLDDIERRMIWTGGLNDLVQTHGVKGVTSNPSIFEKAIGGTADYDAAIRHIVRMGTNPIQVYEALATEDIQWACDVLRPVFEATDRKDGFVSLEVSPHLANDPEGTVDEAIRLWESVGRENLMIKVPGTDDCIPAISHLIGEGLNVNVTLLFSVDRYREVHEAYIEGLEHFLANGGDPKHIASVASFFVSRIDSLVDKMLDERQANHPLRGKIAIANAKMAYRAYTEITGGERWKKLAAQGARAQRLLWASTSTKDAAYRDVRYVEELIGPDTVNTVPRKTFDAFNDHGEVRVTLTEGLDEAEATMKALAEADVSMAQVTAQLEDEGVKKFADAFDGLLGTVAGRREVALGGDATSMIASLGTYEKAIGERLGSMADFPRRLWQRDGTLFGQTPADHGVAEQYMGWLDIVQTMDANVEHLVELAEELEDDGIRKVVLMGMGGSSLAPDVFRATFGQRSGSPELIVLDSTVPAQVKAVADAVGGQDTVFMVASKSGTTTEPLSFDAFFFDREKEGEQFIAITDPGSKLERMAMDRDFRAIYNGDPEVGGRYSALSPFGMVPAAAMGLDVVDLLDRARLMVASCDASAPPASNPGVQLGVILGELALAGRDKLTLVCSESIETFGAWLEQLIAESTGKHDKGIVPVDREDLGAPDVYGSDRVFALLAVDGDDVSDANAKLDALASAGHPVIRIALPEKDDIFQEMYRWEIATATAGHVMGINPFDQPNVQESKTYTADLLKEHANTGSLPAIPGEVDLGTFDGVGLFTDEANADAVRGESLADVLKKHLGRAGAGDYVGLNAYVHMNDANDERLQRLRHLLRDRHHVATTVGFGPRFLHSTGQLHKGGANNGVFLQITCDDAEDLAVPGQKYTFGTLKRAQESGDFMALAKRDRRLLRVHLGADVAAGLDQLIAALG